HRALDLARHYPELPIALNNTAWEVVARSDSDPAAYRLALSRAQAACRAFPNDGLLLNTLGVAQFRMRMYRECIETLTHADQRNSVLFRGAFPPDMAFLAMAHFRVGQKEKGREFLQCLREAMQRPRWAKTEEGLQFMREADNLFQGRSNLVGTPQP